MHCYKLSWRNTSFEDYNIYVHIIPGDGNCLVHAVCHCTYIPYHTRILNKKRVTRREIVTRFRYELADKLEEINPITGVTNYMSIYGGEVAASSHTVPEYRLEAIQSVLRSNKSLDETVVNIIEWTMDISIYVLDVKTKDVYIMTVIPPERDSIVLYYTGGHFDAVSIKDNRTGIYATVFKHTHPLIIFLRNRMDSMKS